MAFVIFHGLIRENIKQRALPAVAPAGHAVVPVRVRARRAHQGNMSLMVFFPPLDLARRVRAIRTVPPANIARQTCAMPAMTLAGRARLLDTRSADLAQLENTYPRLCYLGT